MNNYPISIYTMRNNLLLEAAYNSMETTEFLEKKIWRTGYQHFVKSKSQLSRMLIFFSNAEETAGIMYIGEVIDIVINEEEGITRYSFKMMYKLEDPKPLSELVVVSNNKRLSNQYIRPYAIVKVPIELDEWILERGIKAIKLEKKKGNEPFRFRRIDTNKSLTNYWQWAYSDLVGNTARGALAEYIVALALEIDNETQENWKPYDLDYKSLKIEVKSSAYLQSWNQNTLSDIRFSIRKTVEDNVSGKNESNLPNRKSDLYIFCLLNHKIQDTINPMNLEQWRFYLLETRIINEELKDTKSISLKMLKRMSTRSCNYDRLKILVEEIMDNNV